MSKLEELIKKLCPNGVKFERIDDVAVIERGERITKKDLKEQGEYKVISGGVEPMGYYNNYNREKNTITISSYGYAGYVNFIEERFWANDVCLCIFPKENINNKFLYYVLKNTQKYFFSKTTKAIPDHIPTETIKETCIPVPPLEVQCEIVHILDDFTLLSALLSAELSAELKARQKQYQYYKNKLLMFEKNDNSIQWMNLGEYCKRLKGTAITAGQMKEIACENGEIRIFAGGKTVVDTSSDNIKKEDIIEIPNVIVQSRGIIDFIYYDKPCSFKREMWSYTHENPITIKYIYYYLKKNVEYFRQRGSQMGSMPQISLDVTEKYKIPIPSLSEQKRIVDILDRFDKLCNDISEGLPAEIEARQKQYEYYRDKLLTFKELKV